MHSPSPTWLKARSSGVLAHVSSLPGDYGIGNLGPDARAFIDFLAEAGFRHWQICPLGPTGYADSPYQSFSAFAGNPYFIDLGELVAAGLLAKDEVTPLRKLPDGRADFGGLYERFWKILARAHERFTTRAEALAGYGSFEEFCATHADWLEPFADFMALKARFDGAPWYQWPEELRSWSPDLRATLPKPAQTIAAQHRFFQFLFFAQWERLRAYAHAHGVEIIGDLPIFVALDSADAWRWRPVFRLDEHGQPLALAGVPPDYFSTSGQFWGNPLYDWEYLAETDFAWWTMRLHAAFSLYDVVRLDHFRGFDTYWEIPAGSIDARRGRWRRGPGAAFFDHVRRTVPEARIIAEDLGYISEGVAGLRHTAGLPGMKILQFGYGHDDNNVNLPHFFPADCVVYTGTHDNATTRGWLESLKPDFASRIDDYFQLHGSRSAWPMIRAAFASVARLAVVPMQDLLDLPASARMNHPGTAEGNWQWRFTAADLQRLARDKTATLREWHALFDRDGDTRQREYSAPPEEMPSHAHVVESAAKSG